MLKYHTKKCSLLNYVKWIKSCDNAISIVGLEFI